PAPETSLGKRPRRLERRAPVGGNRPAPSGRDAPPTPRTPARRAVQRNVLIAERPSTPGRFASSPSGRCAGSLRQEYRPSPFVLPRRLLQEYCLRPRFWFREIILVAALPSNPGFTSTFTRGFITVA